MNKLQIEGLYKVYDGQLLLKGVNLAVNSGEILCLLGSSGSGKSTILRIIAGIEKADQGRLFWDGVEVSTVPVHKRGFVLMFQDYALFPHLSVFDNIAFGLHMKGINTKEARASVKDVLDQVTMSGYESRNVSDLSGGEQQRVALARALAVQPRLLMLDEPLAALDRALRLELQGELKSLLHKAGIPVIYVTHDQEEALSISDRIAILHDGRIVQDATSEEVFRRPVNLWVAGFLGMNNLIEGKLITKEPLRIEVSGQKLDLPSTKIENGLEPGSKLWVLLPPSAINTQSWKTLEIVLHGKVIESTFKGSYYLVSVILAYGKRICFSSMQAFENGKEIQLYVRKDEVALYSKDSTKEDTIF